MTDTPPERRHRPESANDASQRFGLPEPEVQRDRATPQGPPLRPDPGDFELQRRTRPTPPALNVPSPDAVERARGQPRSDVRVPEAGPYEVTARPRTTPPPLHVPDPHAVERVRGSPRSDVHVPEAGPYEVAARERTTPPPLRVPDPNAVERPRGTPRTDVKVPEAGPYHVAARETHTPPKLQVPPPSNVERPRGTPRADVRVPEAGPYDVRARETRTPPVLHVPPPNNVEKVRGTPRSDVQVPSAGPYQVAPRERKAPAGPNPLAPSDAMEAKVDKAPKRDGAPLPPPGPFEVKRDQPVRSDVPPLPTDPGRVEVQTNAMHPQVRVMTTGVFDLIHLGHIHMLEAAKQLGSELVVVIARDETVRKMKHDPLNPEEVRRQIVAQLKPVDQAVLGHHGDIYRIVSEIRPDIIALGYDQKFTDDEVRRKCLAHGVDVRVVRLPQFDHDLDATRKIIERIGDRLQRKELYPQREQ